MIFSSICSFLFLNPTVIGLTLYLLYFTFFETKLRYNIFFFIFTSFLLYSIFIIHYTGHPVYLSQELRSDEETRSIREIVRSAKIVEISLQPFLVDQSGSARALAAFATSDTAPLDVAFQSNRFVRKAV